MTRKLYASILLVVAVTTQVQGQSLMVQIDSTKLPKEIKYKGYFVSGYQWSDKQGLNTFCVSKSFAWKDGVNKRITKKEWASELRDSVETTISSPKLSEQITYQHIVSKGKKTTQLWRDTDFIGFCEWSGKLILLKNTVHITDFNHNGIAEVWYGIHRNCSSDLSPSFYKLVSRENKSQLMRMGSALILWGGDKWGGNTWCDDFNSAPVEMLKYAQQLWNDNIIEELH